MWQYSEYLAVSEDFIPVFSEDVDKNYKEGLKSFIPHNYMGTCLKIHHCFGTAHGGDKRSLYGLPDHMEQVKTFTCLS